MPAALRPMTLGEILDRTFEIYRRGFLLFLGIVLLSSVGSLALGVFSGLLYELALQLNLGDLWAKAFANLRLWAPNWQSSLADLLTLPILVYAASCFFLQQKTTVRASVPWCTRRWQSWIGFGMVLLVAWVVLPRIAMRPLWIFRYQHASAHPFGLSASWAALAYQWSFDLVVWLLKFLGVLAVGFSVPAWSLERIGIGNALRRGWTIAKPSWFRLAMAVLMSDMIKHVLDFSFGELQKLAFLILSKCFGGFHRPEDYSFAIFLLVAQAASLLTVPLLPIAITLIYYDVRIRREGFGVERLMEAAGIESPQAASDAEPTPSQQAEEPV
jgi:hypothetical protein